MVTMASVPAESKEIVHETQVVSVSVNDREGDEKKLNYLQDELWVNPVDSSDDG
jgi:hypothetical protein